MEHAFVFKIFTGLTEFAKNVKKETTMILKQGHAGHFAGWTAYIEAEDATAMQDFILLTIVVSNAIMVLDMMLQSNDALTYVNKTKFIPQLVVFAQMAITELMGFVPDAHITESLILMQENAYASRAYNLFITNAFLPVEPIRLDLKEPVFVLRVHTLLVEDATDAGQIVTILQHI